MAFTEDEISHLRYLVEEWVRRDPDSFTRHEILSLQDRRNWPEIKNRLLGRLVFGTAGLRGRMEAGTNRMNSLTIIQTSQGLAAYLLTTSADAKQRGVVIGRDARKNSDTFARDAARAFMVKGIRVHWHKDPVHTPLVPFAVDQLNAVAGIMITASHNPKDENGYKVYWSNGCQIIPPHDVKIAAAIESNLDPQPYDNSNVNKSLFRYIDDSIHWGYFSRIMRLTQLRSALPEFVYTPLHGVGFRPFVRGVQHMCGMATPQWQMGDTIPFEAVPRQMYPHPDFPTVIFPNPEEKGVLDLAIAMADEKNISLIIANDPDADRLSVAQKVTVKMKTPSTPVESGNEAEGEPTRYWHQFTGNQVGILLASHILDLVPVFPTSTKYAMLRSTVSTSMLDVMAVKRGYRVRETLTGFKWLGNVAKDLQREGIHVNFAFEEALGYMFPSIVYDKDGISAGAMFLAATAKWRDECALTPYEKLEQLYQEHGYFAEANTYLISPSPAIIAAVFADIRAMEHPHPSKLATATITRWRDLTTGYDSATHRNIPSLPVDPSSQMFTLWCGDDLRITVRASGTEPKIKFYVECKRNNLQEAQDRAVWAQGEIILKWFTPHRYGLIMP